MGRITKCVWCVYLECGFVRVTAVTKRLAEGVTNPPELGLKAVVNCLMRPLGTELESSGRVLCDLNRRAMSPAPHRHCFNLTGILGNAFSWQVCC